MMVCLKHNLLILLIAATGLLVSGETVITCHNSVQTLSCNTGLIKVTSTVYGRTDSSTCPTPNPSHKTNGDCEISISTVADRCNGQQVCEIKTPNIVTREPCPKKPFNYYITTYECTDGRDIIISTPGNHILDCGENIIEIIDINWRRLGGNSNGVDNDQRENPHCPEPTTLSEVQANCNGQHSCIVDASISPCHVVKYLSVTYQCSRKIVTCEGLNADLSCGALEIKIANVEYGREDTSTCSAGRPVEQLINTACTLSNALDIVYTRCDGQSTCNVLATHTPFNDPCPGIYKYLTIEYFCV